MKINLKKMLPYFEDEELMEIYEKLQRVRTESLRGLRYMIYSRLLMMWTSCFSGLLKWERIYRNICRMCRTRAFTS